MRSLSLLALLILSGLVGLANPPFSPPHNVSSDPHGKAIPIIKLPPGELINTILRAEKLDTVAGVDAVDWSVKAIKAPAAWDAGFTGKGVKVAVLDTGICKTHRDLKDALKDAKDFTDSKSGTDDIVGHSSHVAGSIAARKNGWGMQGVAYNCDLYVAKVLNDQGQGSVDRIRDGILHAVKVWKVDVINMSFGGGNGTDDYIPAALKAAEEEGVIVIAASGNQGNEHDVNYPAAYPFPVAVSAIDSGLKLAEFSCTGAKIECCGPGVNVRSTYPGPGDGLFADHSGTSMASPNIAGAAALWIEANPHVAKKDRPAAFKKWLRENSTDLGEPGRDSLYGWGLPDLSKLRVVAPQPRLIESPQQMPETEPNSTAISEADLNEAGRAKLKKLGLQKLRIELQPAKPSVRKLTLDEIGEELKAKGGSLILFVGVEADLENYPRGVELIAPPDGLEAGVYDARLTTKISLKPIK